MAATHRFKSNAPSIGRKPYHYRACGLNDVYLLNGFEVEETAYGRGVMIQRVEDLHRAIGLRLISDGKPLSARELRFLRKQMGFTQAELAARLRVDVQTVARYEKEQCAVSGPVDGMVRVLYALYLIPEDKRGEVLAELKDLLEEHSQVGGRAMYFEQTDEGWDARVN